MRLCVAFSVLSLMWIALSNADTSKIVCYYGSWAAYRNGSGKLEIADIDPSLCTHLIWAFVGITADANVRVLDPWLALPDNWGKSGFQKLNALRTISVGLKTLVATGGWDEGSERYSKVMANATLRSKYVKNVVDFVLLHGFDGFDVDWQYPNQRGGSADDVQNYVLLLKELREAFDKHKLLLTAAVGASEIFAKVSYDIPQISKHLDFINLLLYDYHGAWDSSIGHCAPLYHATREVSELGRSLNVNSTVHYWLRQGAPAEKLILGTGLYGISFTLRNSKEIIPGSSATGPGQGGPSTHQMGFLGYNEICNLTTQDPWTSAWDEEQRVPYAYAGDQWISYDNVKSITEKANYAKSMGLGGAMVWSLETDDHQGNCGEKFPLLKALNRVVRNVGSGDRMSSVPEGATSKADEEAKRTCVRSNHKYIRNSQNCAKFWICQKILENEFNAVPFSCGDGLYFDTKKKACKSKDSVDCS